MWVHIPTVISNFMGSRARGWRVFSGIFQHPPSLSSLPLLLSLLLPLFVYVANLERMKRAEADGCTEEAEQYRQGAMEARNALPQFNLNGLWVGK
jgi:hypothetical protein